MTIRILLLALLTVILGAAQPPDTRSLADRLLDDTPPTPAEPEPEKPSWKQARRDRMKDISRRSHATQARLKAEIAAQERARVSACRAASRLKRSMSGTYRICPGGICR